MDSFKSVLIPLIWAISSPSPLFKILIMNGQESSKSISERISRPMLSSILLISAQSQFIVYTPRVLSFSLGILYVNCFLFPSFNFSMSIETLLFSFYKALLYIFQWNLDFFSVWVLPHKNILQFSSV